MKEPILYILLRPLIKLYMKIIYNPKYIGTDNIPSKGRIVLSGNHTNNLDCLLIISSTKRYVHFLAKDSLMKGIKKVLFKNMGIIPVNRQIHDKKALNDAITALQQEKTIGIFPEGTINRTKDTIMPFKIGCVKMAHDTDSYIVPFIITGEYKAFRNNLTIEYLKPYKVKSDDLTNENNKLMDIIKNNLEEKRF